MRGLRTAMALWWLAFLAVTAGAPAMARQDPSEATADEPILTVEVFDSGGAPIAGAEAYLIEPVNDLPLSRTWIAADEDGVAEISPEALDGSLLKDEEQTVLLVVRAPGYAWALQPVTLPAPEPVRTELKRGREVQLRFTTSSPAAIPKDLVPVVFAEGQSVAAWLTNVQGFNGDYGVGAVFNTSIPKRENDGTFRVPVPDDCAAIWVMVNHAGYLRAFQAGPFDRAEMETGLIELELPQAATLDIRIGPDPDMPHNYAQCALLVYISPEIPEGGWTFVAHRGHSDGQTLNAELADLAPQYYSVNATADEPARGEDGQPAGTHRVQQGATLEAGQRHELEFAMQTFDEDTLRAKLKGEHTLKVRVTLPDGSPAAGKPYRLAFVLYQFGREIDLVSGTVPESGEIVVNDLPPGSEASLAVRIDGEDTGSVFIDADELETIHDVQMAPGVGDLAPDMELTRLADGSIFHLSDLRGQVVFVDFWASWCGPCQEPMAHSDSVMAKRKDWDGRALILGASIDNDIEIIREHVDKKGWTNVVQAYCSGGEPGWACDAVKRFAVRFVPTCYLIDQNGRIAWTGHPLEVDVEKEIDALLGSR